MLNTLATLLLCAPVPTPNVSQDEPPATPREIQGTRISLTLPERFAPLARYAGFGDPVTGEAVVVTEVEAPLEAMVTSLKAQTQVESAEIKPRGLEKLANGSHPGTLFRFEQKNSERHSHKWIWVFGSEKECVVIASETNIALGEDAFLEIRKYVTSAEWLRTRAKKPLDALPYEFATLEGLQFALVTGPRAIFTADGQHSGELGAKPIVECALGTLPLQVSLREFAEDALKQDKRLKKVRINLVDPREQDGLQGFAVIGTGQSLGGNLVFTYDLVLAEGASYIRISSLVGLGDKANWERKLEKVVDSFRRKRIVLKSDNESFQVIAPATWEALPPLEEAVSVQAGQHIADLYLTAASEERSSLEDMTLAEYHAATVSDFESEAGRGLEPRALEIGGMPALLTEYDYPVEGVDRHFLHVVIESKTHFYVLTLHCLTAKHAESKADLESVLMSFSEV